MKCVQGEYGNIRKEGGLFSSKTVIQDDVNDEREYKFNLRDIKKILRQYNKREYKRNYYYGLISCKNGFSYRVLFSALLSDSPIEYPITIGCKGYSKETVEVAIKAFL